MSNSSAAGLEWSARRLSPEVKKNLRYTSPRTLAADRCAQHTTSTTLEHFAQELFRKGVRGANPQIDLVITLPLPRIMHEQSGRMLQMKPLRAIRMAG